jgi:hypothetical protein
MDLDKHRKDVLMSPEVIERSNGHEWAKWEFTGRTLICCNNCGLVRRADGTSNPCKGRVRVELRTPSHRWRRT